MVKQIRPRSSGAADATARAAPSRARGRPSEPIVEARPGASDPRSDPMRLAAEVARLEAELALMRARVAELETRAERDPLTAVLNRRGFARELARARAYVERYGGNAALVYLDLDGFKRVNDRHGHAAGDAVLTAVAAALVAAVRASDVVARIGGDEFAVLLWNLSVRDAHNKAIALERGIADATVAWNGEQLAVGASAGVADLTAGIDVEGLLARADAEMYARKRTRR